MENIEARAKIEDVEAFRENIKQMNAEFVVSFSVVDHLFQPKGVKWDMNDNTMKVRETDGKVIIKCHLVEWKDGIKSDKFGFKQEVESLSLAFEIMNSFNFEKVAEFSKKGELYKIPEFSFYLEEIEKLGWSVEVEAETREKVKEIMDKLGLTIISKSVPKMIQEKLEVE